MLRHRSILLSFCTLLLYFAALLTGCQQSPPGEKVKSTSDAPPQNSSGIRFREVAQISGIHFQYSIPGERPITILQSMNGGAAFLDYDGDGNLDILLSSQAVALYHGDGKGNFTDVTNVALPPLPKAYWMAIAVGDYDNDGYDDVYLSSYRGGALLHNEKGKRFSEADQAGIPTQPWGSACAFGDYDGDGKLDLFVGNYVDFGPKSVQHCRVKNVLTACSPTVYNAEKNHLYRNLGGGKFQDVTASTGISTSTGKALGAIFADIDGSGRQSLLIANDEVPTDLMLNQAGGKFKNVGDLAGVAYLGNGSPYGAMGVDRGDINHDGTGDFVIGTFTLEEKLILIGQGNQLFLDQSESMGMTTAISYLTFGEKLVDFDNDGWLDLMLVNGYIADNVAEYEPTRTYRQPTLLFRNDNGKRFIDVSKDACSALQKPIVGRALAIGDYDNDGRQDALIADCEGPPLLLHNETAVAGNYLSLKLIGKTKARNAYGAKVIVEIDGEKRTYWCYADGSYLSSNDPRVHIGLKKATTVKVTISWPGGKTDTFTTDKINCTIVVTEGIPPT